MSRLSRFVAARLKKLAMRLFDLEPRRYPRIVCGPFPGTWHTEDGVPIDMLFKHVAKHRPPRWIDRGQWR